MTIAVDMGRKATKTTKTKKTCKFWSCYVQSLRRKCIYKKYLIVTWSIALYIMWPMCLQSLKLLQPMVKERHLQENTLFNLRSYEMLPSTLDIMWPMYQQNWCCYIPWLRRRCIYKIIHYLTLTFRSRSQGMLPSALYIMWPMHLQSLKLLRQKVKEEIHLQENSIFDRWPWGQGHTKSCQVPSTSCDLFSDKVWSCYV